MRAAAAARRAALVLAIEVLAVSAAILIPSCAAWPTHDSGSRPAATRRATASRPRPRTRDPTAPPRPAAPRPPSRGSGADATLAAALAPVLRDQPGRLAVGIIDQTTGRTAVYHGTWPFDTASIIKADILAVLLIQHQQIGTALSPDERRLATAMIEDSDNNAATALWDAVEGGMGMEGRQRRPRPAPHVAGRQRHLGRCLGAYHHRRHRPAAAADRPHLRPLPA